MGSNMSFEGSQGFSSRDSHRSFELLDVRGARRADLVARLEQWEWFRELRNRFDLAIEVLDLEPQPVLGAVPYGQSALALRAALQASGEGTLRETAAAVGRTAKVRSMTTGRVRVRLFPLFVRFAGPPVPVAVLLIADTHLPGERSDEEAAADIDRRLDMTGQWLVAAIEAAMAASAENADQVRTMQRLAGIVDVIDVLSRCERETEIVALVMDAIAVWYDADVRVYRQDCSGAFLVHTCLPAVNPHNVTGRLAGEPIASRQDVFRLESMSDAVAIGWDGPADTLFAPLIVDDAIRWLLTVSGPMEPSISVTLGLLARIVSVRLTHLLRDTAEHLRERLRAWLTFGDAPFDATARQALETIARETGALSATIATYIDSQGPPALLIGWASGEEDIPPFMAAGTTQATTQTITVSVAAGSNVTAVLALRGDGTGFSTASAGLAQSAADMLGVWLAGAMVRQADLRLVADSEYSTEFVGRLAGHVDEFGRLKIGGTLAVVLPALADFSGAQLDDVMQAVQEQVRASDLIGIVGNGAGVLIPDADGAAASALVDRLLKATHRPGGLPVKIGVTTFPPLSESPDTLVRRALTDARRESSIS
jgi:hypothetical protein